MTTKEFLKQNAKWLSAGALLTFLSSFGQTFFISLFSEPIRHDFNLTHGEWSSIYSIGTAASAVVMVWAGGLTDRFRTRGLGVLVLAGLASACAFMALNPTPLLLIVAIFLLRFFGQGMASHTAVVAMSRWFVATRGRALAICALGFTIGEAIFPILVVALMALMDWRILWGVAALITLAGLPYLLWSLKTERSPQQVADDNQSEGMKKRHWTRKDVLSHPLFWLMIPALLGPAAFNTTFFFHHAHFAEIKGMTQLKLVTFFPIYTVVAVAMMVASGWLVDRYGSAKTMPFYQMPMLGAFVCFAFATGPTLIIVGLVFLAMSAGANSTLPNVFWAEFYGTRHIGSIKAMAAAVMVLGSAVGPLITGRLIDRGLALDTQYIAIAGFFGLSTICMAFGISTYKSSVSSYLVLRK
ncbi:MAG: MFS transporter [Aliishimia sp.]